MKLRTQLILAFLLLSVLPLTGIVLYSFYSSSRAFERAVEAESEQLTEQITHRMDTMRFTIQERLHGLASLPRDAWAGGGEGGMVSRVESLFSDQAELLDGVEWQPADPSGLPAGEEGVFIPVRSSAATAGCQTPSSGR